MERWKGYGFVMTPAEANKMPETKLNPETKKEEWCYDWPNEDLLYAKRLGVFHEPSDVFSIDFDDESYIAHKYLQLLPDTFTDGRMLGSQKIMTHRTYKVNGQGAPTIGGAAKYPKKSF